MDNPAEDQSDNLPNSATSMELDIVDIAPDGDIVLDVTFDTSKETLKAARKAAKPRPGQQITPPVLKPRVRLGYRVQLAVLKQNSKYFDNLLGDTRFAEAKSIEAGFQRLSLSNVKPSEADARDLPVVKIHEDDEATRAAGLDSAFGDLLRILHRKQTTAKPVTMHNLGVLAVLADRFDCTAIVSRYLSALKYKWPATQTRLSRDDGPALSRAAEETLRQKILVSWLLDQPLKMHAATRELILYGSRKWSAFVDEDTNTAAWWDLPDDLENELQHRRDCILNTIASVHRHFVQLYTSRTRQCTLGYDSSASCDSYQLGEMIKFLVSRDLLFLVDFSSKSMDSIQDYATVDIVHVLATLRQCPNYQIDTNHHNCGLRTRILPILDHIQAMLSSNIVSISRPAWSKDREAASWQQPEGGADKHEPREFRFTRSVARDQRLRYEGSMAVDRMAKALFTADRWDWTAEDREEPREMGMGKWNTPNLSKRV
ncbi:hypothetical protein MMYC01_201199 [Madurella mycetomatis]|uniref:Hydroxyproline-rich glyco protein n=1 Tax=Madurella mycetomatis TaxID=100816 RepID=A0A175WFI8_9PEZI|nr:hypothetical protein MMYC01_209529 [Madurella mycetomatis]KXX82548.1 hypothetical protein MMYC01_201199 [Madurella mycetomatis]